MKTPLFNYIRNLHFRQIVIGTCFGDFFALLRATSNAVLAADRIVSAIYATACDKL